MIVAVHWLNLNENKAVDSAFYIKTFKCYVASKKFFLKFMFYEDVCVEQVQYLYIKTNDELFK
jgi:hypothetical protein